jgi:hypothetical protein
MVARIPTVFSTLIHRRRRCVAAGYVLTSMGVAASAVEVLVER